MSTDASSLFSKDLYTIYANGVAYDSTKVYDTDTVFTVSMNFTSSEIPLALLFAAMQIGLSDIAAYRTQAYMEKIESNQALQTTVANVIASIEDLQGSMESVSAYIAANAGWSLLEELDASYFSVGTAGIDGLDSSTGSTTNSVLDSSGVLNMVQTLCLGNDIEAVEILGFSYSSVFTEVIGTKPSDPSTTPIYYDTSTLTSSYTVTLSGLASDGQITEYTLSFTASYEEYTQYRYSPAGWTEDSGKSTDLNSSSLTKASTSSSIYSATLTDDILEACTLAGITTIDGKTITSTATFTSDQLTMLIEDLELAQETASTTTQTDMVYAEEYLGQYNAYLTGSSSTLDDLSSALMSIAGRMR